ncbi:MAG: universal stress protein, partial [Coleofasciculus sp. S288]|nr:universal stress protein [Coleofasciculus sp. S288]
LSKFLAAALAKLVYRYNLPEMMTMWSLSMPQVGATLAATLVGYRADILDEGVLNSVIVLMLTTSTLGPILTSRFAPQLDTATTGLSTALSETISQIEEIPEVSPEKSEFTVVVPIYNPKTQRYLMEMATLLVNHEGGRIVPLAIAQAYAHMDSPEMDKSLRNSQWLLEQANELSRELGVEASPQLRIEYDVAQGISHASRELNASMIVLGLSGRMGFRARLFGNVTDSVLWSAHCLVVVARLLDSPLKIQRILVPIESLTTSAVRPLRFAHILADINQAQVTLLHVCDPRTPESRIAWTKSQLEVMVSRLVPHNPAIEIQIVPQDNVTDVILKAAQSHDLVVLRSLRRRVGADGLAIGEVTTPLVQQLSCSVVLLGEPQGTLTSVLADN